MYRFTMFLKRGMVTMLSYKTAFVLQTINMFFGVASFYFLSKLVGNSALLKDYGGDYLTFLLLGVVFNSFIGMALNTFNGSISTEQKTGTLEYLLMSRTPLSAVMLYSAAWSFLTTALSAVLMLALASALFGMKLGGNPGMALLVLLVTIVGMSGIGMLSAGIIMVTKQGDPVTWALSALGGLLSGVYYPVKMLPAPLQAVSAALPMTHALSAMRAVLMTNASSATLPMEMLWLVTFAAISLPVGIFAFRWGFDKARRDGTLAFF
jgi:ABC-2 type transport system permease protein